MALSVNNRGEAFAREVVDVIGDGVLMYSSDYPHGGCKYPSSPDVVLGRQRLAELEQENLALRARLDGASERVQMLVARLAFLERDVEEGAA